MKRILFLLIVALITLGVLLFLFNPQALEKVWLWIIGLIGVIVSLVKRGIEGIKGLVKPKEEVKIRSSEKTIAPSTADPKTNLNWGEEKSLLTKRIEELEAQLLLGKKEPDTFEGTTITMLRYLDDGDTTLGLLFFNGKFFCYTLEDTFRESKIAGQTRIPKGSYRIGFNQSLTDLTKTYREKYPWFKYHIQLKNVANYEGIYIHVGNYHQNTDGCILIADGIGSGNKQLMVTHSQQAYKRFYQKIEQILGHEEKVRINILDEAWFATITKHSDALLIN